MRDTGIGRRATDREIDPTVEMYVQDAVRETRHELRGDITALAAAQAAAALQATKEHGEVRIEMQAIRADVAALRTDLVDLPVVRQAIADLKHRDDVDDARATALDLLRKQQRSALRWLAGFVVGAVPVVAVVAAYFH